MTFATKFRSAVVETPPSGLASSSSIASLPGQRTPSKGSAKNQARPLNDAVLEALARELIFFH